MSRIKTPRPARSTSSKPRSLPDLEHGSLTRRCLRPTRKQLRSVEVHTVDAPGPVSAYRGQLTIHWRLATFALRSLLFSVNLTAGSKMLPLNMSQPVKLSDELVLEARTVGKIAERSIAGQVEFWARLGKALEPILRGDRTLALQQAGSAQLFSEIIASVDSAKGRQKVHTYLETQAYPHFEQCPDEPGMLVKINEDGSRTRGRFVNRKFVKAA
jgi:hypothetical protein